MSGTGWSGEYGLTHAAKKRLWEEIIEAAKEVMKYAKTDIKFVCKGREEEGGA